MFKTEVNTADLIPQNIRISVITHQSIIVRWIMNFTTKEQRDKLLRFEVIIKPRDQGFKIVIPLSATRRSVRIESLSPNASYQISVIAIGTDRKRWKGASTLIRTAGYKLRNQRQWQNQFPVPVLPVPSGPDTLNETAEPLIEVHAEEVSIVLLVLGFWAASVLLFFNRWGKIRMLLPYQPVFKEQNSTNGTPLHSHGNQPILKQQQSTYRDSNISCAITRCGHHVWCKADTYAGSETIGHPSVSTKKAGSTDKEPSSISNRNKRSEIPKIQLIHELRRSKSAETITIFTHENQRAKEVQPLYFSPVQHRQGNQKQFRSWAAYRRHTDPWLNVLVELAQSRVNLAKEKSTLNLECDDKNKKLLKPIFGRLQAPSFLCSQASVSSNSSIATVINMKENKLERAPKLSNVSISLPLPKVSRNSFAALNRQEKPRSENLESMKRGDSEPKHSQCKTLLEKYRTKVTLSSQETSNASSSANEEDENSTEMIDVVEQLPVVEDIRNSSFDGESLPHVTRHRERRKSLLQLRKTYLAYETVFSDENEENILLNASQEHFC
ncbi:uncharacterized protein LOC136025156 isoform X2 [Artemia franciscana]|uniref:uncharacterized protein LOC136025156 isoform X2 n=1 Tax=Artemia franciscana TaxID=6661 RepID=UPI0032DBDBF0